MYFEGIWEDNKGYCEQCKHVVAMSKVITSWMCKRCGHINQNINSHSFKFKEQKEKISNHAFIERCSQCKNTVWVNEDCSSWQCPKCQYLNIKNHCNKRIKESKTLKLGKIMYIEFNSIDNDIVQMKDIHDAWITNKEENGKKIYFIEWSLFDKTGHHHAKYLTNKKQRDADFKALKAALKKGSSPMIEKIKEQYKKHEDVLFPLLVLMALDFFFNDGRFQKKITNVVNGMLTKVTDRFEEKALAKGETPADD